VVRLVDYIAVWAQAEGLRVHLVGGDNGGLHVRDVIAPLGTLVAALIGGLGGVTIGARMNRRTLTALEDERAGREDWFDVLRAGRERELELERERRRIAGEQRQAAGSLRLCLQELERMLTMLALMANKQYWLPADRVPLTSRISAKDQGLVATWVSHGAWSRYVLCLAMAENVGNLRLSDVNHPNRGASIGANSLEVLQGAVIVARETLQTMRAELERLMSDLGEPAPSWTPVEEYGVST
jgi:hypothetical protein